MTPGELVVLSASGTDAPVAWRERLAVRSGHEGAIAAELRGAGTIAEALVLSTCGRFDVYAVAADPDRAERELVEWTARRSGSPVEAVSERVSILRGRAAARHLIATAAGLRSSVLGEHEILGQVRRAQERGARAGATGPMLDRLVVDALRAGRRVRATTALGRGSVSVLSVSVELALAMFPGEARRAFVLGRSRTASAARDRLLAAGWAVTHAPFLEAPSRRGSLLAAFDVIVACTGTRGTVIPAQALENAAAHRDGAPVIVLDLSVPRDVDPRAAAVDGVLLHDVDTLALAAAPSVAARRAGIADAERIVDDELSRFETWCADQMLAPTIKALRSHVRDVVVHALGTVDSTTVEQLVNRMLHAPTRRLRAAAADGRAEHFTRLVRSLFGLDDELPGPGRAGGAGVTG